MVHQYKNNGYDIVLDVNSGAIHVVDDVTYDVIEMIDQSQPESYARDEIVICTVRKTTAKRKWRKQSMKSRH